MNYSAIKYYDIANGPGVRVSLFVSGCRHHCKNCFNEEAWAFNSGKPFTEAVQQDILEHLAPSYIEGITILGGEPFEPENQPEVYKLIMKIKEVLPQKSIWIYSGFTLEQLRGGSRASGDTCNKILYSVDVLVDGPFIEDLKDISLEFRGSKNQRILHRGTDF